MLPSTFLNAYSCSRRSSPLEKACLMSAWMCTLGSGMRTSTGLFFISHSSPQNFRAMEFMNWIVPLLSMVTTASPIVSVMVTR
ncbi:MAG: hypothetical protein BWZ01_01365 [Deltaproteobacteria bacterium ADurb.BinA179]|nr:MAG: hypothetical protein BWZ01_01365 [Deltaproteobacteria bacterium ADurb.BinA179]